MSEGEKSNREIFACYSIAFTRHIHLNVNSGALYYALTGGHEVNFELLMRNLRHLIELKKKSFVCESSCMLCSVLKLLVDKVDDGRPRGEKFSSPRFACCKNGFTGESWVNLIFISFSEISYHMPSK